MAGEKPNDSEVELPDSGGVKRHGADEPLTAELTPDVAPVMEGFLTEAAEANEVAAEEAADNIAFVASAWCGLRNALGSVHRLRTRK